MYFPSSYVTKAPKLRPTNTCHTVSGYTLESLAFNAEATSCSVMLSLRATERARRGAERHTLGSKVESVTAIIER
jgi:hypothetical protein